MHLGCAHDDLHGGLLPAGSSAPRLHLGARVVPLDRAVDAEDLRGLRGRRRDHQAAGVQPGLLQPVPRDHHARRPGPAEERALGRVRARAGRHRVDARGRRRARRPRPQDGPRRPDAGHAAGPRGAVPAASSSGAVYWASQACTDETTDAPSPVADATRSSIPSGCHRPRRHRAAWWPGPPGARPRASPRAGCRGRSGRSRARRAAPCRAASRTPAPPRAAGTGRVRPRAPAPRCRRPPS